MQSDPFFSVVVPLYNKELYINRALVSILNQSFNDFEIIVVDDGSTDNGALVVLNQYDERLGYIKKANGGESSARNVGIKAAKGKYITFLDADDQWDCVHLEVIKNFIGINDDPDVVCTNYKISNENGVRVAHLWCANEPIRLRYFKDSIGVLPLMTSNTSVLSRRIVDKVGYFNESLTIGPDLDYWMRVAAQSEPYFLPKPTATYHQEADGRQCRKYRGFNTVFIDSMIRNITNTSSQTDARKYVDVLFWREIRQMFYFGRNQQCRLEIKNYSKILQLSWIRWLYLIATYMPVYLLYSKYRTKNVLANKK